MPAYLYLNIVDNIKQNSAVYLELFIRMAVFESGEKKEECSKRDETPTHYYEANERDTYFSNEKVIVPEDDSVSEFLFA